ncbi:S41 family peptidase [Desulfobulbus sp.]|uniref:S41 family peptidase n=1 Tax=Desulfobulbus sp. TaxID=895 RepID=UPI0027BA05B7|nr:S41 family peptidase [Desulfobulbus sp.]
MASLILSTACRPLRGFALIVVGLALYGLGAAPTPAAWAQLTEEAQLLTAAVEQIRDHGLAVPRSSRKIAEDLLRAYAHSLDDYSDYLTAREYAAFLESTSSDYFGVEMDMQQRDGTLRLYPFKRGLAEKSGIAPGDELVAVNGSPVYGKSVYVVGAMIRGAEGATVQLTIRTGQAIPRSLTLRRQRAHYQSVVWKAAGAGHFIQITRFAKDTAAQLRRILEGGGNDGRPILLDLRGNQGGSLISARECAELFVRPGTVLFQLRDRDTTQKIEAEQPQLAAGRLTLLQDNDTASAAEAFIAALTADKRALSVGAATYGKGLAQRFLPLPDGSALLLTYAEILTPEGVAFHQRGLAPGLRLPEELARQDFSKESSITALFDFITTNQD